jgi:hypothetical protein
MEEECDERVLGVEEGWSRPHLLGVPMLLYLSVGWNCCSSKASQTTAEVTKHTYEVMDDFENSNCGKRVR